ncbi:MAG: hypothetical protein NTV49_12550 [Kiritimatiellaeota bacterium]|nr:hypothetical protein [Kiritimatiellota bacterium]
MKSIRSFLVSLALLAAAGCATPAARIKAHPQLFASFAPDVQAKVRLGEVALGFSRDAVRMALGEPGRIYHRVTTNGVNEVWAYTAFDYRTTPQYATVLGSVTDPWPNTAFVPGVVLVDVQQRNEYETLRLEFENDRVRAIEALKK